MIRYLRSSHIALLDENERIHKETHDVAIDALTKRRFHPKGPWQEKTVSLMGRHLSNIYLPNIPAIIPES